MVGVLKCSLQHNDVRLAALAWSLLIGVGREWSCVSILERMRADVIHLSQTCQQCLVVSMVRSIANIGLECAAYERHVRHVLGNRHRTLRTGLQLVNE
jgi:hypothetical protein